MANLQKTSPKTFLGASIPNTKVLSSQIDAIITRLNNPQLDITNVTTSAVTLTKLDSGSTVVLDRAAGTTITLPNASTENIGVYFEVEIKTTVTSNAYAINAARTADLMIGGVSSIDDTTPESAAMFKPNGSSNYQCSMNGGTTGGKIGTTLIFKCIAVNRWLVTGTLAAAGVLATPFAG